VEVGVEAFLIIYFEFAVSNWWWETLHLEHSDLTNKELRYKAFLIEQLFANSEKAFKYF